MATAGDSPNAEDTLRKNFCAHTRPCAERAPLFASRILASPANLDLGPSVPAKRRAAIAQGLVWLGLKRSQTIAIVGANRPRLYWSITTAPDDRQRIPVPVYADAVAEEIAAVLDHSGAAIIIAQDQEQIDKILSVRDHLRFLSSRISSTTRCAA